MGGGGRGGREEREDTPVGFVFFGALTPVSGAGANYSALGRTTYLNVCIY